MQETVEIQVVWKFDIEFTADNDIKMPEGAELLMVTVQGDAIKLWARCDPGRIRRYRHFKLRGTGHPIDPRWVYVGSVMQGLFVWHLFEDVRG